MASTGATRAPARTGVTEQPTARLTHRIVCETMIALFRTRRFTRADLFGVLEALGERLMLAGRPPGRGRSRCVRIRASVDALTLADAV